MPWKRTSTVKTQELGYKALTAAGVWVFRGTQSVFGWNKDAEALSWVHAMPDDQLFGMKTLFAAPDSVVTLRRMRDDLPQYVVWLSPSTGQVRQERLYDFLPSQSGFTAAGGDFFLHGQHRNERWALLRISAETGSLLEEAQAPEGQQIIGSLRRLYVFQGVTGLSHSPLERVHWTHNPVGKISTFGLWGNELFFFRRPDDTQGPWDLLWWNADEASAAGQMATEATQAMVLTPGPRPGLVAGHLVKQALWVLDIAGKTCLWKYEVPKGERLKSACWTPHGLVISRTPSGEAARLELRETSTGELLETLPSTLVDSTYLFWLGDRLISSGVDGLEAYAWEG